MFSFSDGNKKFKDTGKTFVVWAEHNIVSQRQETENQNIISVLRSQMLRYLFIKTGLNLSFWNLCKNPNQFLLFKILPN